MGFQAKVCEAQKVCPIKAAIRIAINLTVNDFIITQRFEEKI
ncbi:MAG: hypothetical protein SCALA701_02250 [Candidatus Scalindua sp.]|nr:MAG: hypothetical protein SCALA701_02250 [Candidatus Scalindua sp.]